MPGFWVRNPAAAAACPACGRARELGILDLRVRERPLGAIQPLHALERRRDLRGSGKELLRGCIMFRADDRYMQRLLPHLSTYLGHVDIDSTAHYLTMTRELLQEANRCFEIYASGKVQHG